MSVTPVTVRVPVQLREYDKNQEKLWEDIGLGEKRPLSSEDCELEEKLRKAGIVEINTLNNGKGVRIKAYSYVGSVSFSTFDLQIRPKFEQINDQTLATLLAYAFGFDDLKKFDEQDSNDPFFVDILIHWLLEIVYTIQRRGLFQQYRKERRDLSVIRGKIDLKTWMRRGMIPSEKMPCVFYRRSLDNVLNQTLLAGLRLGVAIAKSPKFKSKCGLLAEDFAMSVSEKTLDRQMLAAARRSLNRLNTPYEKAVNIIELLYNGSGGFIFGGSSQEQIRIPGFFFNMNVLFEKFIGEFLERNLEGEEWKVKLQCARRVFYDEDNIHCGTIKPDIVVYNKTTKMRYVLDTKYRDIKKMLRLKPNVDSSQKRRDLSVLYQLGIYALACSNAHKDDVKRRSIIIYPGDEQSKLSRRVLMQSVSKKEKKELCEITLRPVDLVKMVEWINTSDEEMKKYALELIGEK